MVMRRRKGRPIDLANWNNCFRWQIVGAFIYASLLPMLPFLLQLPVLKKEEREERERGRRNIEGNVRLEDWRVGGLGTVTSFVGGEVMLPQGSGGLLALATGH